MENRVLVLGVAPGNIGEKICQKLEVAGVTVIAPKIVDIMGHSSKLIQAIHKERPTHAVYSVGINKMNWLGDIQESEFVETMRVNVGGFIGMMQELKLMTELSDLLPASCSVVAITSDAAWRPMRTSLSYCASKAALEMAVRVASRELAEQGWRVNAVAPGKVEDTPMTEQVDKRVMELRGWSRLEAEEYELFSSPIGRKVTKEEVADTVISVLFGPPAMTGQVIAVNGGR